MNAKITANASACLATAYARCLLQTCGRRTPDSATPAEKVKALAWAVRERCVDLMLETHERQQATTQKTVGYLSMEFLLGRALENNLMCLGLLDEARALLGVADFEELGVVEPDPALGNGGLGRLAACFLDSLATLGLPATGYGLNYEFGLFRQRIDAAGNQRELPDNWLPHSSPWLVERPEAGVLIPVYGRIDHGCDSEGGYNPMWVDWGIIVGVAYDMPIVGHGGKTVNVLRLFSARGATDIDLDAFNGGDYIQSIRARIESETISKVLYPNDHLPAGQELRLLQEYFLVACAVRDVVRQMRERGAPLQELDRHFALQLNDTHPALTVAELMRLLIDEERLDWDTAWGVTQSVVAYTNHTLMPEALERWPLPLLERVIPRHTQLILEINRRFLDQVAERFPGEPARVQRMSIVEESAPKQVRMAHLSIVGSHSINGVAAIHSQLVRTQLVPDFYEMWPERFNNKTNGVTPRRWLCLANPRLSRLLDDSVGPSWVTELAELQQLENFAADAAFRERFRSIKHHNKQRLSSYIKQQLRLDVDPHAMFDVQIKRMHEYKRQLLNCFRLIDAYFSLLDGEATVDCPRVVVFAGKAAPGYFLAKLVIRLIHGIAKVVNQDPLVRDRLQIVFLPDYRVSLAERIVPAADLSEQISTAGTEASGTGNMKLMMNGALTLGTFDGANVEIAEAVGAENIYIFGKRVAELAAMRAASSYEPRAVLERSPRLQRVVNALDSELFGSGPGLYRPLVDRVLNQGDPYFLLADFEDYLAAQACASADFASAADWDRRAILNVARSGFFSSDRTIRLYAREIWELDGRVK